LNEAQLRAVISEMMGAPPDNDWQRLDDAMGAVKRSVQGLQGVLSGPNYRGEQMPSDAGRIALRAQVAVKQLQVIVDRVVASTGGGTGA